MATRSDHKQKAQDLLATAQRYGMASPARPVLLAEAQVYATLALLDTETVTVSVGDVSETTTRPARRPRKATATKTTAEVTAAGKSYGDLPEATE